MPRCRYKAKDEDGRVHCRTGKADNNQALFVILRSRGLYCYEYSLLERTPSARPAELNQRQLPLLCRQLVAMLTAGAPPFRVLEVSAGSTKDRTPKVVLIGLRESTRKERILSEVMEKMKGISPNLLVYMTHIGESSGRLDELPHKVTGYYGREEELNSKVQVAMTYSTISFSITVLAAVFMLTTVLPQFVSMLQEQGPPWITRVTMRFNSGLHSRGVLYIMPTLVLMTLFKGILTYPFVRLQISRAVLYAPIIGKLLSTVYTSRFASAFAMLYEGGIGILDTMYTVGWVMGSSYMKKELVQVTGGLRGGMMLSQTSDELNLFQPVLTSTVVAGEESGALDMVLEGMGSFYERETVKVTNQMIAPLESTTILILALVAGSVVVAIIIPVSSMYSSIL